MSQGTLRYLLGILGLLLCWSVSSVATAEDATENNLATVTSAAQAAKAVTQLQSQLDELKQQVARTTNDKRLESLSSDNQQILARIDSLATALQQQLLPVTTQLNILGPPPGPQATPETPEVVARRQGLSASKASLDTVIEQTTILEANAQQLAVQIAGVRRNLLAKEVSLNNGSILSPGFWTPMYSVTPYNYGRVMYFWRALDDTSRQALAPDYRLTTVLLLLAAISLPLLRKRVERPMTRLTVWLIPEGRLIRSFYAMALILANATLIGLSAWMFAWIYLRMPGVPTILRDFFTDWLHLCLLVGFMLGVGRALISKRKPSWRLARISDGVALALNPFPRIIAGILFFFGTIEIFNSAIGASVSASVMASGLTALALLVCVIGMIVRVNRVKTHGTDSGNKHQDTPVHGVVYLLSAAFALVDLLALITGYIGLARYLTYKATWVFIVIATTFFLLRFWHDLCESLFSENTHWGRFLIRFLKLEGRHLGILAAVFTALGKVALLGIMLVALFYGSFGTTGPLDLVSRVYGLWSGQGMGQLNIAPAHLMAALVTLVVAAWCLRQCNRWLADTILPKTQISSGMQASISTLFINLGYVLVIMMTLASMGVKWSNLAWIVSALSVGIGFGLQEIVKNFISGLILLTERPVRVGDLVTISGIEGDIKKISVRATEIQLGDRSTVIVPNSQFISQNVRNVTRGNSLGVVTITLTYPLDCDPVAIRTLLLAIFRTHEAILDTPEPSVFCTDLTGDGITISVTGCVLSPRLIFGTRSDLLFEVLHQLRERNIPITVPKTVILERPPGTDSETVAS